MKIINFILSSFIKVGLTLILTFSLHVAFANDSRVTLISQGLNGASGNGTTHDYLMTPDERYILFSSDASNLVPNDNNDSTDVFQYDLVTHKITRLSVDQYGRELKQDSYLFSKKNAISADGNVVLFRTNAGLNSTQKPGFYAKNLASGSLTFVVYASPLKVNPGYSVGYIKSEKVPQLAELSFDGQYVFYSTHSNVYFPTIGRLNLNTGQRDEFGLDTSNKPFSSVWKSFNVHLNNCSNLNKPYICEVAFPHRYDGQLEFVAPTLLSISENTDIVSFSIPWTYCIRPSKDKYYQGCSNREYYRLDYLASYNFNTGKLSYYNIPKRLRQAGLAHENLYSGDYSLDAEIVDISNSGKTVAVTGKYWVGALQVDVKTNKIIPISENPQVVAQSENGKMCFGMIDPSFPFFSVGSDWEGFYHDEPEAPKPAPNYGERNIYYLGHCGIGVANQFDFTNEYGDVLDSGFVNGSHNPIVIDFDILTINNKATKVMYRTTYPMTDSDTDGEIVPPYDDEDYRTDEEEAEYWKRRMAAMDLFLVDLENQPSMDILELVAPILIERRLEENE